MGRLKSERCLLSRFADHFVAYQCDFLRPINRSPYFQRFICRDFLGCIYRNHAPFHELHRPIVAALGQLARSRTHGAGSVANGAALPEHSLSL